MIEGSSSSAYTLKKSAESAMLNNLLRPRTYNSSGATAVRKGGQRGDPVINDLRNTLRIGGIVLKDAPNRGFEIIGSLGRPLDCIKAARVCRSVRSLLRE
jgi:hypothetical protein